NQGVCPPGPGGATKLSVFSLLMSSYLVVLDSVVKIIGFSFAKPAITKWLGGGFGFAKPTFY
ncbi:MAG: hypothetical protein ACK5LU_12590, partial [Pseudanabaena sp.]